MLFSFLYFVLFQKYFSEWINFFFITRFNLSISKIDLDSCAYILYLGKILNHLNSTHYDFCCFSWLISLNDKLRHQCHWISIPNWTCDQRDGKWPDNAFPFEGGKLLLWDFLCFDSFSYANLVYLEPGISCLRCQELKTGQIYTWELLCPYTNTSKYWLGGILT